MLPCRAMQIIVALEHGDESRCPDPGWRYEPRPLLPGPRVWVCPQTSCAWLCLILLQALDAQRKPNRARVLRSFPAVSPRSGSPEGARCRRKSEMALGAQSRNFTLLGHGRCGQGPPQRSWSGCEVAADPDREGAPLEFEGLARSLLQAPAGKSPDAGSTAPN